VVDAVIEANFCISIRSYQGGQLRRPAITWYPTCHHHAQHAPGAHVYLPLFSWHWGGKTCLVNLRFL